MSIAGDIIEELQAELKAAKEAARPHSEELARLQSELEAERRCTARLRARLRALGHHHFVLGDVIARSPVWEPNDFDRWGRGDGIGIVVDDGVNAYRRAGRTVMPADDYIDVRWPGGTCYEVCLGVELKIQQADAAPNAAEYDNQLGYIRRYGRRYE